MSLKVVELSSRETAQHPLRPNPGKEEIEEVQGSAQKTERVTTPIINTPKSSDSGQSRNVVFIQKSQARENAGSRENEGCCSKKCLLITYVAVGILSAAYYYTLQWADRVATEMDILT